MKYILPLLLLLFIPALVSARKHQVYGDVGHVGGASLTYNYKISKYWGLGGGLQGYNINRVRYVNEFTPAIFADVRLYMRPEKKNQFFSMADAGLNIYKVDTRYKRTYDGFYHIPHNNGFYMGFGFGYLRQLTSRGSGVYASAKLMTNWSTIWNYYYASEREETGFVNIYFTPALSLGFKF